MATLRFKWGYRGYIAVAITAVAVASAFGFKGEQFEGVVTRVIDGDTVEFQTDKGTVTVRVAGIDAPELKQAYGLEAKQEACKLALGKTVHVIVKSVDKYHRRVAVITLPDGKDFGEEMIRLGAAWWYSKYDTWDPIKKNLQNEARASKLGLWSIPQIVPPWQFRLRQRPPKTAEGPACTTGPSLFNDWPISSRGVS